MTDYFVGSSAVLQQTGAAQIADWPGGVSHKFTTNRKHVPKPEFKEVPHPLFSTFGKKHYEAQLSDSYNWKPSIRVDPDKDHERFDRQVSMDNNTSTIRPKGTKKIEPQYADVKDRPERRHVEPEPSGSYEDLEIGKKTFIGHNRKTVDEVPTEKMMGTKKRTQTMYDQRNGVPLKSLGDKIYKAPEYMPGFYKDGGLIVGSTHQKKIKTSGNAKAIDFYAGLELGKGPLNPNRKLWTDAVKEEILNEELSSVQNLKKWERNVLKEVDPKYQVSDDSDDEKKK